jgi:hypothetical protein
MMEKETVKLLNVLKRIARAAGYAAWTKSDPVAARFCVSQYNKVLARLTEIEPAVTPLFTLLAEDASPEVTRIAARELLAYFEADLSEGAPEFSWAYSRRFASRSRCRPHRSRVRCGVVLS